MVPGDMCVLASMYVCARTWAVAAAAKEGLVSLDQDAASSSLGVRSQSTSPWLSELHSSCEVFCASETLALLPTRPAPGEPTPLQVGSSWSPRMAYYGKTIPALGKSLETTHPNALGGALGRGKGPEGEDERSLAMWNAPPLYKVQTRSQRCFAAT